MGRRGGEGEGERETHRQCSTAENLILKKRKIDNNPQLIYEMISKMIIMSE